MMKKSFAQYKAAADRIRRGREQPGDAEICEAYDTSCSVPVVCSVYDLPIARAMFTADARDTERE